MSRRFRVHHAILAIVAACSAPAPQPAAVAPPVVVAPLPPAFEPTSFGVVVSGHGRPVIFIPGLGCPGSVWDATVAHLANAESHQLTLAGFAGRPAIADPRLAAKVVHDLAVYIRDRKLDHPVIVGHSMGGFIAFWLAAIQPELVGPVVVVDAMPTLGTDPSMLAMATQMRDSWSKMTDAEFAAAAHEFFGTMVTDPAQTTALLADVDRSDHRAIGDAFYELFAVDLRSQVPKITAPLLAILADGPYQQAMKAQIATIPHAEVIVVPHSRHFVMWDAPTAFDAALDGFLAAHR